MNRIKELRQEKKLSLQDLKEKIEEKTGVIVGRASLSNYEREEQTPKKDTWQAIADALNVSVDYLMGITPYTHEYDKKLYSKNLSEIDKLVNSNVGANVEIKRMMLTIFIFLFRFKDDANSVKNLSEYIRIITSFTDPDTFLFEKTGREFSNQEIIKEFISKRDKLDEISRYFGELGLENVTDDASKAFEIVPDRVEEFREIMTRMKDDGILK